MPDIEPLADWELDLLFPKDEVPKNSANCEHENVLHNERCECGTEWAIGTRERRAYLSYDNYGGPAYRSGVWHDYRTFYEWLRLEDAQAEAIYYEAIVENERFDRRRAPTTYVRAVRTIANHVDESARIVHRTIQAGDDVSRLLWQVWLDGVRWRDDNPDTPTPEEDETA